MANSNCCTLFHTFTGLRHTCCALLVGHSEYLTNTDDARLSSRACLLPHVSLSGDKAIAVDDPPQGEGRPHPWAESRKEVA